MESASVRLASRCGGGRSIRPHRCAVCAKRHNDAVESTVCGCSGSQIARSRTSCPRQFSGVRMKRTS
eukprot:4849243-Lingulodinium_polyedra.AAC.1